MTSRRSSKVCCALVALAAATGGIPLAASAASPPPMVNNTTFTLSGGVANYGAITGTGSLVIGDGGVLTAESIRQTSLLIGDGTVRVGPRSGASATVSVLRDVVFASAGDTYGSLDLTNTNLIVRGGNVGSFAVGGYTGLSACIAASYDYGGWDCPGITTSQLDASAAVGVTTLAIATADETFYAGGTFGGVSVASGDVIIMYTHAGDANLDGLVDAADYGYIDNYFQFPGSSGYANGDFNYDGIIDAGDYGIIDNAFQLQGTPFPTGAAAAGSDSATVSAVPEPSACALAMIATCLFVAGRTRRRRSREA